jgi:CO/xanthine dehydrogenase FAD-binding subunit
MAQYLKAVDLDEALRALAAGAWTPLAGGTDFYPARAARPIDENILDLSGLEALCGMRREADGNWRIGALVSWTGLRTAELPPGFNGLKEAAAQIGGLQVQNSGTIGGNLCNASPAADGVPPLLALDAEVELASTQGTRRMKLDQFITGNRQTGLKPGELLTAILIPNPGPSARSSFLKLGQRSSLAISLVMVSALARIEAGVLHDVRVAVGACSPVARRLDRLETLLEGKSLAEAPSLVRPEHLASLSPISDGRASADYRMKAALVLARRAIAALESGA